jgi:hypothetical protein
VSLPFACGLIAAYPWSPPGAVVGSCGSALPPVDTKSGLPILAGSLPVLVRHLICTPEVTVNFKSPFSI